MMMGPRLRKFVLTAHIASSVGWFGAVAAFLALAIAGLTSQNVQMVQASYLAMALIGWFVIVPLSLASLLIGLIQALCTTWGLFRHYWVLLKFLITTLATVLLLVHMQSTSRVAAMAAEMELSSTDLRGQRIQLVTDSGAALLALLVTTTLSVYKPRGMTAYGRRKLREQGVEFDSASVTSTARWVYMFTIIALALLFVLRHLTHGGLHGHGH